MDENMGVLSQTSSVITESEVNTQIIEEGPQICPLCSSEIKLFFINYHEKFLMCENIECEFPFGHEELQILRYENNYDDDENDVVSELSQTGKMSSLSSEVSDFSDVEKLKRLFESEDSQSETKAIDIFAKKSKAKNLAKIEKEKKMQKNLEDLKELSLELSDLSKSRTTIKKQKWINNLMHLQDQSGLQLVEPVENKKNNEVKNDLKIDIEPGSSGCMSAIKIQITNQDQT